MTTPSVVNMSVVNNYLRRRLLLSNIIGSFILSVDGHLQYFQVVRLVICLVTFIYSTMHEFYFPKSDFQQFVKIVQISLDCCAVGVILRVSWQERCFKNCLEAMEIVSKFANVSKISIVLWPSVLSNILFIVLISLKAYDIRATLLAFLSELQVLLIVNCFSDELSTVLFLLGSLSKALDTQLARTTCREDLDSVLKAHDLLRSAVRQVNDFYSLQILCTFALGFFSTTTSVFLSIKLDSVPPHTRAATLLWAITFLQLLLKIILSASSLTERIDSFDLHLYEIFKSRPTSWTKLVTVDDLIVNRTLCLSAAGFFDLTIENFGSMISAATTYLVILLQMD